MMHFGHWAQAARIPSNVNLIFPLLFGQAFALGVHGRFSWALFALVMLYGWFDQLFIVFWNDYADRAVDGDNQSFNLFSGGSRVVPEGKISARKLFIAGAVNAGLVLSVGLILTVVFNRPLVLPLFLAGLLLLWMYSFAPVRLNYRGGGEILQGLGCGVVLPIIGFYVQAGTFAGLPWLMLLPFFLFHYTSSIATALPDRPADARAVKRTLPVLIGVQGAGRVCLLLCLAGIAITLPLSGVYSLWVIVFSIAIPLACVAGGYLKLRRMEQEPASMQLFDALLILLGISYATGFCMYQWMAC